MFLLNFSSFQIKYRNQNCVYLNFVFFCFNHYTWCHIGLIRIPVLWINKKYQVVINKILFTTLPTCSSWLWLRWSEVLEQNMNFGQFIHNFDLYVQHLIVCFQFANKKIKQKNTKYTVTVLPSTIDVVDLLPVLLKLESS